MKLQCWNVFCVAWFFMWKCLTWQLWMKLENSLKLMENVPSQVQFRSVAFTNSEPPLASRNNAYFVACARCYASGDSPSRLFSIDLAVWQFMKQKSHSSSFSGYFLNSLLLCTYEITLTTGCSPFSCWKKTFYSSGFFQILIRGKVASQNRNKTILQFAA